MNRFSELRQRLRPVPNFSEFARRVGCSDQTIRLIEQGATNPGLEVAYRIADELNATVYEVWPRRMMTGRSA